MAIIVPDFYQIIQIEQGSKTLHRWPAGQKADGTLCAPKMASGSDHQVYEHARHGKYGDPHAPPLLLVRVHEVWPSWPQDWTNEEIIHEGFGDLEAYGAWWERFRVGSHLCKPWIEMQQEPFWVARFTCLSQTPMYEYRCVEYAKKTAHRR